MRLLIAVVLGLALPAPAPGTAADAVPKVHTVTIDATRFSPVSLDVAPGDRVVWKNGDLFPHTATSRSGAFDSKEIAPGKSWTYVVPKRGRLFEYYCTLHPTMTGRLRVTSEP